MIAPAAPTLTAKSDPCPGVEVLFPSLDPAAATITVWRVADGVTEEVAGAKKAVVSGDFVVTDSQVPFGVVSTYVGQIFDVNGASITGASSIIQVDSDVVWFQNAVDPSASFTVKLQLTSLGGATRATHNTQQWVAGVPRPFNQYWGEGALTGIPLEIWSRTDADVATFKQVTSYPQLLIRTPPRYNTLPRLLYAAVQAPQHRYQAFGTPGATVVWNLTVDEVQPFSKAVIRPLITWDDWTAAFPAADYTWDDVMAIYAAGTWTDAVRNPPNA